MNLFQRNSFKNFRPACCRKNLIIPKANLQIRTYIFIGSSYKENLANNFIASDLPRANYIEGKYICPWSKDTEKDFSSVMKMLYERYNPRPKFLGIKDSTETLLKQTLSFDKLNADELNFSWLGHSTCLFRSRGVGILTDPVWNERVGPPFISQFMGPKRLVPPVCSVSELTPFVDIILVSHSHYDHLDLNTVEIIGNSKLWIVPLGVKAILNQVGVHNCIELDWWQDYVCKINNVDIKITLTPAKHWSARTFYDRNTSLWGSFVITLDEEKLFFAGDTAYCPVFKLIGEKYGPFTLSAIPIGAYKPRWFLKDVHCDPTEAIHIHKDLRSKQSVAVHWGTYPLAEDDSIEPALELAKARKSLSIDTNDFFTLSHGETICTNKIENISKFDIATGRFPSLFDLFMEKNEYSYAKD